MSKLAFIAFALATLFVSGLSAARPSVVRAEGIEVRSSAGQNRFPDGAQFTLSAASTANITSVRLRFRILPDGPTSFARPTCTTGMTVTCNVTVGSTAQNYMVPGAEIQYQWEIEDAGGQKLDTSQATLIYNDTRFQWESVSDGNLTVYYYFGDDNSNRSVLRTARETVDSISTLVGTTVDFRVKVWVYQTVRDLQPAVASSRTLGPSSTVRTLGEVGASDTALVARDTDFLNIVRHELAHIVTNAATRDHIADIPVWINEGISTYSQRELLPDEKQSLDLAVRRNAVLPLSSLGATARSTADTVSLFYGQSGSIISFLVQTYGAPKFAEFIAAFKNDTQAGAIQKVYGMDQLAFENAWRRSVGLAPVAGSATKPGSTEGIPTIVPFGSSQGSPAATPVASGGSSGSQTATEDDGGSGGMLLIGGGVVVVLLVLGGGAFALTRRKSSISG